LLVRHSRRSGIRKTWTRRSPVRGSVRSPVLHPRRSAIPENFRIQIFMARRFPKIGGSPSEDALPRFGVGPSEDLSAACLNHRWMSPSKDISGAGPLPPGVHPIRRLPRRASHAGRVSRRSRDPDRAGQARLRPIEPNNHVVSGPREKYPPEGQPFQHRCSFQNGMQAHHPEPNRGTFAKQSEDRLAGPVTRRPPTPGSCVPAAA